MFWLRMFRWDLKMGVYGDKARGVFYSSEVFLPDSQGLLAILKRQPLQVIRVRTNARQLGSILPVAIKREQFGQENRHGPSVHQQVVVGKDQAAAMGAERNPSKTQQRTRRKFESLFTVRGKQFLAAQALRLTIKAGKIDPAPRQIRLARDNLNRVFEALMQKRNSQVWMAMQKNFRSRPHAGRIHLAHKFHAQLHCIGMGSIALIEAMKQHAFLQRRERKNIFKIRASSFEVFYLLDRQRDQRKI